MHVFENGIMLEDLGEQLMFFSPPPEEDEQPIPGVNDKPIPVYLSRFVSECPTCGRRLEMLHKVDKALAVKSGNAAAFRAAEDNAALEGFPTPATLADRCDGPEGWHGVGEPIH